MKDIYPLTIVKDRYNGVYSGGGWLAINDEAVCIDEAIRGDDVECMMFWAEFEQGKEPNTYGEPLIIGRGRTIEIALADLESLAETHLK